MIKRSICILLTLLVLAGIGAVSFADNSGYGPSSADLNMAGGKKIKYPRQESFYLDDYIYGKVAKKRAIAYLNPNASDVMADNNTFYVYQGESIKALAQSSGYMCVIFTDQDCAGWINRSDLELYAYFSPEAGARPSKADLDFIRADCKYPAKSTLYLDRYIETTMKQGTGLVYLNPNAGNATSDSNTFDVKKGENVIIIAETSNLACCIFPNMARAGWVDFVYLKNH